MRNHGFDTVTTKRSRHAQHVDCLEHTGFPAPIWPVENIHRGESVNANAAQVSHTVYLELG